MPTLHVIGPIAIRMFARDHLPPHFHILTPDGSTLVRIDDLSLLKGRIRRQYFELAIEWATKEQDFLRDEWNRLNRR